MTNKKCHKCGGSFTFDGHHATRIHIFTRLEREWWSESEEVEKVLKEKYNHDFYLCMSCAKSLIELINEEYDNEF